MRLNSIVLAAVLIVNVVAAAASPLTMSNPGVLQPWSEPLDVLKVAEGGPVGMRGSTAIEGPKAWLAGNGAHGPASSHPGGASARGSHQAATAAPALEPRTSAMWLAWLGVLGFLGVRRRSRA